MFKALKNLTRFAFCVSSLWCLLIAVAATVGMEIHGAYRPRLEISVLTPKTETIQVFCDAGTGFNEQSSSSVTVSEKYKAKKPFVLGLAGNCARIRLDLGSTGAAIAVLSATLHSAHGTRTDVLENVRTGELHDGHFIASVANSLMFVSEDADPYVVLAGDFTKLTRYDAVSHIVKLLCIFIVVFFLLMMMDLIRKREPVLFIVMLTAVLLRSLYYLSSTLPVEADELGKVWPDEGTYFRYVNMLMEGGLVQYFSNSLSIEIAPGNILYLASLMGLFDSELSLVRMFNVVVLSSLVVIFTFQIACRLFDYKTAIGAALLVSVYPELMVYAPTLLTEYLFITLLLGFIWLVLVIKDKANTNSIYWAVPLAATVGVMTAITRLVFLPVAVLVAVYAGYFYFRTSAIRVPFAMASLAALMALVLTPFFINGHRHTGNYMIATGSGAVLWLGSRADTEGDEPPYRGKSYDTNLITHGVSHISPEGDKLLKEAALRNIAGDPCGYALLFIKKVGRLFVGNNYFWFFPHAKFSDWRVGKSYAIIVEKIFALFIATVVIVFGLAHPIVERKMNDSIAFVFLAMLGLAAVYLPFLVNQRYGLPVFVLSSVFATNVLLGVGHHKKKYKWWLLLLTIFIVAEVVAGR